MGWETALDRLLLQQVHLAEKGELKADGVRLQLLDYGGLDSARPGFNFLCGYARTLLGIELPSHGNDPLLRRWSLFGVVRAYDRRGERERIAETMQDPQMLLDLLSDPMIAGSVLPIVVRSLFWSGDLKLAVRAIQYLAAEPHGDLDPIVDAAVTDLLGRLETRVDADDQESTASILGKMLAMAGFERLPRDVTKKIWQSMAARLVTAGIEVTPSAWASRMPKTDEPGLPILCAYALYGAALEPGAHWEALIDKFWSAFEKASPDEITRAMESFNTSAEAESAASAETTEPAVAAQ